MFIFNVMPNFVCSLFRFDSCRCSQPNRIECRQMYGVKLWYFKYFQINLYLANHNLIALVSSDWKLTDWVIQFMLEELTVGIHNTYASPYAVVYMKDDYHSSFILVGNAMANQTYCQRKTCSFWPTWIITIVELQSIRIIHRCETDTTLTFNESWTSNEI